MTSHQKVDESERGELYAKSAEKLLRLLGGNRSYKGFDLTTYSIEEVIEDPGSLTCICKGLYVNAALQFHTTIHCVERNIRTIRTHIWKHGDRELLMEIFGMSNPSKSPCNSVFIDKLAQYVKEHSGETFSL